jgi:hypothetical protein
MYVSFLIVGTAIVAAGIALVGSGVSIQDHTFDPAVITPGAVAVVGGLILVGLAFVLQQLRNIEKAMALRPVVRSVRSEVSEVTVGPAGEPSADHAVLVPPKGAAESAAGPEQSPAAPTLATPAVQEAERLREKFPSLLRLDNAPTVEESEVSILPKPPVRSDEAVAEAKNVISVRQVNGGAVGRSAPRLDAAMRPNGRSDRVKNFDSFWPKRKRPAAPAVAVQTAVPEPSAGPVLPIESAPSAEPESVVVAAAPEAPTPVSILKSGVVDGMAYTLYSDGSIEAQLPQGTLRFGSITELRSHIEQSA